MIIPTKKTTLKAYEEYISYLINREETSVQTREDKIKELYHQNYELALEIFELNGKIHILKEELNKENGLPINSDICQAFAYIRDSLIEKINVTCKAINYLRNNETNINNKMNGDNANEDLRKKTRGFN